MPQATPLSLAKPSTRPRNFQRPPRTDNVEGFRPEFLNFGRDKFKKERRLKAVEWENLMKVYRRQP